MKLQQGQGLWITSSSSLKSLLPTDRIDGMPGFVSLPWGFINKFCYVLRQWSMGAIAADQVGELDWMLGPIIFWPWLHQYEDACLPFLTGGCMRWITFIIPYNAASGVLWKCVNSIHWALMILHRLESICMSTFLESTLSDASSSDPSVWKSS